MRPGHHYSPAMIAEVIVDAHHWLEYLSWGANATLAVVGIIALFQVHAAITQAKSALAQNKISLDQLNIATAQLETSRQDIVLRSRREALELTFQQCEFFADRGCSESFCNWLMGCGLGRHKRGGNGIAFS